MLMRLCLSSNFSARIGETMIASAHPSVGARSISAIVRFSVIVATGILTDNEERELKPINQTYVSVALRLKNVQASGGVGKREAIKNLSPFGL
uniref:Uncharacterized protein n=1 Tax=Tanacetum cinerariifolium TaxID=118510 RepID=A0A699UMX1_TANCI|nr:hypothetical protein [Tanacetum cinerariifolium]